MIYQCPKGHTFIIPKRGYRNGKVIFMCPECGCEIKDMEERDRDGDLCPLCDKSMIFHKKYKMYECRNRHCQLRATEEQYKSAWKARRDEPIPERR